MSDENYCEVHDIEMTDVGHHGVEELVCPECFKEVKELRTRVAEIEGARKRACADAEILAKENEELQNRLSQAEDLNEMFRKTYVQPDCQVKRMREQIQFIEQRLISKDEDCKLWMDRYTTLLKASEGMEKALEEAVRDCEVFDVSGALEKNFPSTIHAIRENQKRYALALADFRAVKETMKKGAGK